MSKTNPLKYAAVADLMEQHELMATAVEAHGVICGLVCGGVVLDDKSWLPPFNDLINDGFGLPAPVRQVMTDLYQGVIESLMAQKGSSCCCQATRRPSTSASMPWWTGPRPSWPVSAWCRRSSPRPPRSCRR